MACVFDRKNEHDTATILTNTSIGLGGLHSYCISQDMTSDITFQIVPNSLSANCKGDLLQ